MKLNPNQSWDRIWRLSVLMIRIFLGNLAQDLVKKHA
jgi:hypothetical protein